MGPARGEAVRVWVRGVEEEGEWDRARIRCIARAGRDTLIMLVMRGCIADTRRRDGQDEWGTRGYQLSIRGCG